MRAQGHLSPCDPLLASPGQGHHERAVACRYDYTDAVWEGQGISPMTARLVGSTCQPDFVRDAWVVGVMSSMLHTQGLSRLIFKLATLARRAGWTLDVGEHLSLLPSCGVAVELCGKPVTVRCLPIALLLSP